MQSIRVDRGSTGTAPGSEKGDEGGTDSLPPIRTERAHKQLSSLISLEALHSLF